MHRMVSATLSAKILGPAANRYERKLHEIACVDGGVSTTNIRAYLIHKQERETLAVFAPHKHLSQCTVNASLQSGSNPMAGSLNLESCIYAVEDSYMVAGE